MNYLLFTLIYFYMSNWLQINTFFSNALKGKRGVSYIDDKKSISLIKKKTGLTLKRITIFNTEKLFGLMPGTPVSPEMILSKGLYESFNEDELEWVLLHEAAHCIKWHTLKCAVVQLLICMFGCIVINRFNFSVWMIPLLGLLFSLIAIQCMKYFEYEADKFSIERVDNPRGVITAQSKLSKTNDLIRRFFYWNILSSTRIKMAKKRISKSEM